MILRYWQEACRDLALTHFLLGYRQFGCSATPGSGKTIFAAATIKAMFDNDMIDYVICLSPSLAVKEGTRKTFEQVLNRPMDGLFGSVGISLTFQSLANIAENVIQRWQKYRLAIVVDEIHHCGGQELDNATAWSKPLIKLIDSKKDIFILSLSGTPWRTDGAMVTTLSYNSDLKPKMHFEYGLREAIKDGVCRIPTILMVDNDNWKSTDSRKGDRYHSSLSALLTDNALTYQMVLNDKEFLKHMLDLSVTTLNRYRRDKPDAGGLIIASSISHAKEIYNLLEKATGESPLLVTSEDKNSQDTIANYKSGTQKWLISVGMVTEGTDIPRLQVCCHLSRICTELHFRQVLGRILRIETQYNDHTATLIMPAQPDLFDFASRLKCDVPEAVVKIDSIKFKNPNTIKSSNAAPHRQAHSDKSKIEDIKLIQNGIAHWPGDGVNEIVPTTASISVYGRFREEVLRFSP